MRLIKRSRKYGIILLLATQSPTKDSIPKEVTRNIFCGVAFAVADHIANDGLLGAGRYRAVLTRLATHNPGEYDDWVFTDLSTTLAAHGIHPAKSHGVMVIRADDITAALAARAHSGQDGECGDSAGEASGRRGVLPDTSPHQNPRIDQSKPHSGRYQGTSQEGAETPGNEGPAPPAPGSLPEGNATGTAIDP